MKKNIITLAILIASASMMVSCTDTCNKKLGDTFTSVDVSNTNLDINTQNVSLVFNTNTLSDLPEMYFLDGRLYEDVALVDSSKVDTFYATSNKIEIVLKSSEAPELSESKSYKYQMHFGDRRNYIDCKHPGMADSYQLDLIFDLTNSNSIFEISNFKWEEFHSAGAL